LTPRLANAFVPIDNDEIATLGGQVVAGRQAGLPRADDDGVEVLAVEAVALLHVRRLLCSKTRLIPRGRSPCG
jgi:hypothetical protein